MATFAVMNGDSVTNVIVADTKETAETVTGSTCIEYTNDNPAGIGWVYNGVSFVSPFEVSE